MSSAVRAAVLLAGMLPAAAFAQAGGDQAGGDPVSQDYILQAKRNMGMTPREDCGKPGKDGAIIVCGRRGPNPNRLPLPEERTEPGERVRGDVPSGVAAANMRSHRCGVSGQGEQCNGGLNALGIAATAAKLLIKLADPEAELEPPAKIPDRLRGSNR